MVILFYLGAACGFLYLCDKLCKQLIKHPPESLIQRPSKPLPIVVQTAQQLSNVVVDNVIKQKQNITKVINQSIKDISKSTKIIGRAKSAPIISSKSKLIGSNKPIKSKVNSLGSSKIQSKSLFKSKSTGIKSKVAKSTPS